MTGLLLQWFTTRQLFIGSLMSMIVGTLIAALAFNFEILVVTRVLQAVGMGLLIPLMFNTILVVYPPEKRGAAVLGYFSLGCLWIFHLTFGKFWIYLLTNFINNLVYAFGIIPILEKIGFIRYAKFTRIHHIIVKMIYAIFIYGYQLIYTDKK